jgi:hypothetical protein
MRRDVAGLQLWLCALAHGCRVRHVPALLPRKLRLPCCACLLTPQALSDLGVPVKQSQLTALVAGLAEAVGAAPKDTPRPAAAPPLPAAPRLDAQLAAELAGVLICLAGMRRASPSRANQRLLSGVFEVVAAALPVSGPLTPRLLDAWDVLVPL